MTTKERYDAAIADAVLQGVQPEKNDPAKAWAQPYPDEGNCIKWNDAGDPLTCTGEPANDVYFDHGSGGGLPLAQAFVAQGFEVEWDGTEDKTIIVLF